MAARLAPGDYDQLHHFIADGVWDAAQLESELLVQADRLTIPMSRTFGSGPRACHQLSQMTAAAKWMPARKFLAVLS